VILNRPTYFSAPHTTGACSAGFTGIAAHYKAVAPLQGNRHL